MQAPSYAINVNLPGASAQAKEATMQAWRFSAHKPIWAFTILMGLYLAFTGVYYQKTNTESAHPIHWSNSPIDMTGFIHSDDPAITYMGRVHKAQESHLTYMDNSGIAFGFKFTGTRALHLQYHEDAYNNSVVSTAFRIWIDGKEIPKLLVNPKLGTHLFHSAMLNPSEVHTVYFQKVSDLTHARYGILYGFVAEPGTTVMRLSGDGGSLPVARDIANHKRKLEFMGGSWASGYAAEIGPVEHPAQCWGGLHTTDVTRGYQVVAARELHAQYHMPAVQAASGLLRSFGGFVNQFMEPSYRMFDSALMDEHYEWFGFNWWVPHAVVVAHGPNDFSDNYCKFMTTTYVLQVRKWTQRQLMDSLMTGQDCNCDDGINRSVITKFHSLLFGGATATGKVLYPGATAPAMPSWLTPNNGYYYHTMVDQIHQQLDQRPPNATWWKHILAEEVGQRAGCQETANLETEAAGYADLVQHIRAKYPDKQRTKIIFACEVSTQHHTWIVYHAGPERSCDAMHHAAGTLGGAEEGVHVVDLSEDFIKGGHENGWSCMLHPVPETHKRAGKKLADFIDKVVKW